MRGADVWLHEDDDVGITPLRLEREPELEARIGQLESELERLRAERGDVDRRIEA